LIGVAVRPPDGLSLGTADAVPLAIMLAPMAVTIEIATAMRLRDVWSPRFELRDPHAPARAFEPTLSRSRTRRL
jgi:hypothetical protein